MYYLDKNVEALNRIFDQNKRAGYLRLDLNENPGGLDLDFIEEVISEVDPELVSEYPETLEFTQVLAEYLGTDIDHICLVNGSAEGIRYVIEAFTAPNGKIVGVTPSYAMFEVYSNMYGRKYVSVPYTEDMEMPIENIINMLTDDTQLLILLNPNNPVGNVYSDDEMSILLNEAKQKRITVLIDEAYFYFYDKTFIDYAINGDHIFVTRTFSKLFSLAGCRLGYVVGWPEGIKMVQKLCTPHNVNAFGMLFAKKIIQNKEMINALVKAQLEGKKHLVDNLKKEGYRVHSGEGNFVFIATKTDPDLLVLRLKEEKGILVKVYNGIGSFGKCLRVSTGEKQYMQKLIDALLELDQ